MYVMRVVRDSVPTKRDHCCSVTSQWPPLNAHLGTLCNEAETEPGALPWPVEREWCKPCGPQFGEKPVSQLPSVL